MRKILDLSVVFCVTLGLSLAASPAVADAPLAEKYLFDGKLAEGAKALEGRLKESPKDDQARFGLGVLQFLQTFEHLGGGLYKYGLRTEKAFLRPPQQVKEFLPQNPNPEKLTYATARQLVQTLVDDLAKVEATLAEVKDPAVKLPLHVGLIKIDPFGQGKPISAAFLFVRIEGLPVTSQQAKGIVIGFDRGDVNLRRAFTESQTFDVIEWVQGTAAAPYLEKGPLTKLADPRMGTRLNNAFGGPFNFIGFGFWFN